MVIFPVAFSATTLIETFSSDTATSGQIFTAEIVKLPSRVLNSYSSSFRVTLTLYSPLDRLYNFNDAKPFFDSV